MQHSQKNHAFLASSSGYKQSHLPIAHRSTDVAFHIILKKKPKHETQREKKTSSSSDPLRQGTSNLPFVCLFSPKSHPKSRRLAFGRSPLHATHLCKGTPLRASHLPLKGTPLRATHLCQASVVDFKIPVLDVKFSSQENCNTKAPLEALLTDMQESNVEVPCIKDTDDNSPITEQCNLILLENGELSALADNNHILVDMNYYDVVDVPLIIEGESLQDHWIFCSHEIFAESLI